MPPRRRRSKLVSVASDLSDGSPATAAMDQSIHQMLKSPLLDDAGLPAFDLEDFPEWWQTSSSDQPAGSCFDSIDPLLHFPDEEDEQEQAHAALPGLNPPLPSPSSQPAAPSPIPARSTRRASTGAAGIGVDRKSKAISPRESHILSERQRRKGMNHLFSRLASLLPETCSKSDKSTIVSEIISYIHLLRKDLEDLDKKRSEGLSGSCARSIGKNKDASRSISVSTIASGGDSPKSIGTLASFAKTTPSQPSQPSNVIISVCGGDVFVTLVTGSAARNRNILSQALLLLDHHKLKVVDANVSTSASTTFHYFHVKSANLQLPKDALEKDLQSLTGAAENSSPS